MFIKAVTTEPRFVEGRKFVERTIESKFGKKKVSITTLYMDNKPYLKKYTIDEPNIIKNFWKSLTKGTVDEHWTYKGFDTTI